MTSPAQAPEARVHEASQHLYEALTHHFGPLDLGAHDHLVVAISEYGATSRTGDEAQIADASQHVYQALTHRFGPLDLGAHQPLVVALAEFGEACRAAGPR
jgi:hypothetical protein